MAALSELSDEDLVELPLDRLAMLVLRELIETDEWNTQNFIGRIRHEGRRGHALTALVEAINWLFVKGLIARGNPGQTSSDAMIVTRAGRQAADEGFAEVHARERLGVELHPRLAKVETQFLIGEYELAAFAAMREIEIRVRELGNFESSLIGVKLVGEAFKPGGGPLADPQLDPGEQVGTMELFAGALGTFKNPPSHRQVDYSDPTEAAEVVLLADLLMRLLDRTAARLGQ